MSSEYNSKTIRTATVTRQTAETDITCTITLDHQPGVKQIIEVSTGIGFLDHVIHNTIHSDHCPAGLANPSPPLAHLPTV